MTSSTMQDKTETILLTALGGRAIETTYSLNDRTATANLAPVALLHLLDASEKPDRVLAMVTQGAKNSTWSDFETNIEQILNIKPKECVG